jgi:hypothetical protein
MGAYAMLLPGTDVVLHKQFITIAHMKTGLGTNANFSRMNGI